MGRSLEGIDRVLGLARGAAGERGKVASRKEDFFVRGAVPHACVHVRAFVCGGLKRGNDVTSTSERFILSLFVDRFRFPIFRFEPPPRRHDIVKNNT